MLWMVVAPLSWLGLPFPLAVAVGRAFRAVETTDETQASHDDPPPMFLVS